MPSALPWKHSAGALVKILVGMRIELHAATHILVTVLKTTMTMMPMNMMKMTTNSRTMTVKTRSSLLLLPMSTPSGLSSTITDAGVMTSRDARAVGSFLDDVGGVVNGKAMRLLKIPATLIVFVSASVLSAAGVLSRPNARPKSRKEVHTVPNVTSVHQRKK